MAKKREWPDHELSNYRIALKENRDWCYRHHGEVDPVRHNRLIGNAMRLAEAIDRIDLRGRK